MDSKIIDFPVSIREIKYAEIVPTGAKLWTIHGHAENRDNLGVFEFKGTLNQLLRALKKRGIETVTISFNKFWPD